MSLEQPPAPSDVQGNPYLPAGPEPLIAEEWAGINTNTTRAGVDDKQVWWLDGFMPLDRRNLRTLYGSGPVIYTAPGGTSVVCFGFFNIGSTPYCLVFLSNGQVDAVNVNTTGITTLLSAGTITAPAISSVGFTQWGRQYLIIVSNNNTNGYWVWDGTTVYGPGTLGPQITLTGVGAGYSSAPFVSILGGHGSGASAVATVNNGIVTSVSLTNPGSGYLATDSVSVVFSGGQSSGSGGSISITAVTGTSLTALTIVAAGANYAPGTSTSITAPHAILAAVALFITNGTISAASITNPGLGYALGSVTVNILPGPTITASATVTLMPFGIQGSAAETYQGHVWVASGPSVFFTAPGSVNDFATSDGGGNFISSDSFLRQSFTQLLQSNGFLYLIGDSSINYISGVTTSGTPPVTQFNNQNADPQIGTPYAYTAGVFGRNIVFANSFGVHMLYGAAVSKIGDELNGVWPTASTLGNFQISSATAVIFERRVRMELVPIIDPLSGATVNKLLMWDGKRWFASAQDISLTFIASQEINSVITAYGTDGVTIRPLFARPSTFIKSVQSRLWDAPGGYLLEKTSTRWWGVMQYYSIISAPVLLSIDNEVNSAPTWTIPTPSYTIAGPSVPGYFATPPQAVGQSGVLIGWTLQTGAGDMSLISATMRDEVAGYRG